MPRVLVCCLLLWMAACGTVAVESDPAVANPGRLQRFFHGDFWTINNVPPMQHTTKKFAITEFVLEFVTEKTLHRPDKYGQALRRMRYDEQVLDKLPDMLYQVFVERLRSLDAEIIPIEQVRRCAAFAKYPTTTKNRKRYVTPRVIDTGNIRSVVLRSEPGLKIISQEPTDAQQVDRADRMVLQELGATHVMRVRIQVGINMGRGTVEQSSVMSIRGRSFSGNLTSRKSLAGNESVLKNLGSFPGVSGEYNLDTKVYLEQMSNLFLTYVDLAAQALRRTARSG